MHAWNVSASELYLSLRALGHSPAAMLNARRWLKLRVGTVRDLWSSLIFNEIAPSSCKPLMVAVPDANHSIWRTLPSPIRRRMEQWLVLTNFITIELYLVGMKM